MDDSNVSSYRSVSNLPQLPKILKKIVHCQLIDTLRNSNYYRTSSRHIVVDTPLKRRSSRCILIDVIPNGKLALLSLRDLMVAFDTVDHAILLRRLETTFGSMARLLSGYHLTSRAAFSRFTLMDTRLIHGGWFSPFLRVLCWDLCCSHSTQPISAKRSDSMVSVIIFMLTIINCMGAAFHLILQLLER